MPTKDSPQALVADISPDTGKEGQEDSPNYWFALINETEMAKFLNLSVRALQNYRYRGGGPRFVSIARRCVKYRRVDGRTWAENMLRSSTADSGHVVT